MRTIERVQSKTPSVYRHDYGGDPLDMHMVTADFRSLDRRMDDLTAYTGISMDDLTWSIVDADRRCANLEMEVAAFDSGMTRVYFDLYDTDVCVEDTVDARPGTLWVDAQTVALAPGVFTIAVQARDPKTGRIQAIRQEVVVEDYNAPGLMLSDPVIATDVRETSSQADLHAKGPM